MSGVRFTAGIPYNTRGRFRPGPEAHEEMPGRESKQGWSHPNISRSAPRTFCAMPLSPAA